MNISEKYLICIKPYAIDGWSPKILICSLNLVLIELQAISQPSIAISLTIGIYNRNWNNLIPNNPTVFMYQNLLC